MDTLIFDYGPSDCLSLPGNTSYTRILTRVFAFHLNGGKGLCYLPCGQQGGAHIPLCLVLSYVMAQFFLNKIINGLDVFCRP